MEIENIDVNSYPGSKKSTLTENSIRSRVAMRRVNLTLL